MTKKVQFCHLHSSLQEEPSPFAKHWVDRNNYFSISLPPYGMKIYLDKLVQDGYFENSLTQYNKQYLILYLKWITSSSIEQKLYKWQSLIYVMVIIRWKKVYESDYGKIFFVISFGTLILFGTSDAFCFPKN